jgi:hypothetical protein
MCLSARGLSLVQVSVRIEFSGMETRDHES